MFSQYLPTKTGFCIVFIFGLTIPKGRYATIYTYPALIAGRKLKTHAHHQEKQSYYTPTVFKFALIPFDFTTM